MGAPNLLAMSKTKYLVADLLWMVSELKTKRHEKTKNHETWSLRLPSPGGRKEGVRACLRQMPSLGAIVLRVGHSRPT